MSMQAAAVSASLKQTGRSQGTNEADTNVSEQRFPWCNVNREVEVRAGSAAKVVCSCTLSCLGAAHTSDSFDRTIQML